MSAEGRVKFNVGGTLFETTRSSLKALGSEYLDTLLDSESGFKQPADGIYFIDRNPDCFNALLNVARYGQAYVGDKISVEMMKKEADFYAVNDWCRDRLKPSGNRECLARGPRSHHVNLIVGQRNALQIIMTCNINDQCREIVTNYMNPIECSQCRRPMNLWSIANGMPYVINSRSCSWCHFCWKCIDCITKE